MIRKLRPMFPGHRNWPVLAMGILWTALSFVLLALGLRTMWNGFNGSGWQNLPSAIDHFRIAAKHGMDGRSSPELAFWGGFAFAVFAGFFVSIGLAMIFEKPSLVPLKNRGFAKGVIPVILVLMFGTAGLGLLGIAIVGRKPLALLLALPCLAFGIGGMRTLLKRRRKRQQRALKDRERNLRRARS